MRILAFTFLAVLLATTSCSESSPSAPAAPLAPDEPDISTFTVNASDTWAFVAFDGELVTLVSVADPAASIAWDIGFYGTSVMLNGGGAGPSDVRGYCICPNDGASDEQVMELSAEGELAAFDAISAADVPSDEDAWVSDSLQPSIDEWYSYDLATHTISAAPDRVWYVRTASGDAFAKLHVIDIANSARDHAGQVTVEFAVQPSAGAEFEPAQMVVVDVSTGAVDLDLETGSIVEDSDDWDLRLLGYEIRVNGGVSGEGQAGAVLAGEEFEAITDASNAPASVYAADKFGGVFAEHRWYRYNIEGNHQIWPTFDVFLIQTGDDVHKIQLINYYGPTGDSRQITFRYERL